MARQARKHSFSGYYHVVTRGVGKQILFEDPEDYSFYRGLLGRFLPENDIELIAYCLMDNHTHLLLHADKGLDRAMKQIAVSYAYHFNTKYDRVGHLFQDRYLSEPIDDERYLLAAVRYIHNNPPAAGLCPREDYRWSSWYEYVGTPDLVSTGFILSLAGGVDRFVAFSASADREQFLDYTGPKRLSDAQAVALIRKELGLQSGTQIRAMNRTQRDYALHILKERGLSVRQLERLTGINRGVILKA